MSMRSSTTRIHMLNMIASIGVKLWGELIIQFLKGASGNYRACPCPEVGDVHVQLPVHGRGRDRAVGRHPARHSVPQLGADWAET